MPTILDQAICIRRWDFSETSQTVSLLTREHGVIRGLAKGAKRTKGAFSGGIDVLTRGELGAIVKASSELATLTAWNLQELYRHVRESLPANRAAMYMADLANAMLAGGGQDPHPAVFDALDASLSALAEASRIPGALLEFQWLLLREAGYQPRLEMDASSRTVGFDPNVGSVVSDPGEGAASTDKVWRARRETIELLAQLERGSPHAADSATIDRANRLLAAYLRHLIGQEPATLRWAFSDPIQP